MQFQVCPRVSSKLHDELLLKEFLIKQAFKNTDNTSSVI